MENVTTDYCVYTLLDEGGEAFYVGITKNIGIRIQEHINTAKKDRSNSKKHGIIKRMVSKGKKLRYNALTGLSLEEAQIIEKERIREKKSTLTNKSSGGEIVRQDPAKRSKPKKYKQARTCPYCGFRFKRLGGHSCPYKGVIKLYHKRCPVCREIKPLDGGFSKHARAYDGYQRPCKICAGVTAK